MAGSNKVEVCRQLLHLQRLVWWHAMLARARIATIMAGLGAITAGTIDAAVLGVSAGPALVVCMVCWMLTLAVHLAHNQVDRALRREIEAAENVEGEEKP